MFLFLQEEPWCWTCVPHRASGVVKTGHSWCSSCSGKVNYVGGLAMLGNFAVVQMSSSVSKTHQKHCVQCVENWVGDGTRSILCSFICCLLWHFRGDGVQMFIVGVTTWCMWYWLDTSCRCIQLDVTYTAVKSIFKSSYSQGGFLANREDEWLQPLS